MQKYVNSEQNSKYDFVLKTRFCYTKVNLSQFGMTNSFNKHSRLKIPFTHNTNFNLKPLLIKFAKPNLSQKKYIINFHLWKVKLILYLSADSSEILGRVALSLSVGRRCFRVLLDSFQTRRWRWGTPLSPLYLDRIFLNFEHSINHHRFKWTNHERL